MPAKLIILLCTDFDVNDKYTVFSFRSVNVQDTRNALAKMKITKIFGNDNLSYFFLKLALPFVESSLAIMFNTSIET